MADVTTRIPLPEEAHAQASRAAAEEGTSVEQYLRTLLLAQLRDVARHARRNGEIFRELHAIPGKRPPPGYSTALIRAQRDAAAAALPDWPPE